MKKKYKYVCKAKSALIRDEVGPGYRPYCTQVKDRLPARTLLELEQLHALLQMTA